MPRAECLNALANSQREELLKFLGEDGPVTFARYTGQEGHDEKQKIITFPPDILLTNYMMLELILTRQEEAPLLESAHNLKFLVFDELHTYRGRQGADVALLIRRLRKRKERSGRVRSKSGRKCDLPESLRVDGKGEIRRDGGGLSAASVPESFKFCLCCGVNYVGRTGKLTKLAILSSEGRATATTLPSRAGVVLAEHGATPDFLYDQAGVAVYVDEPLKKTCLTLRAIPQSLLLTKRVGQT